MSNQDKTRPAQPANMEEKGISGDAVLLAGAALAAPAVSAWAQQHFGGQKPAPAPRRTA